MSLRLLAAVAACLTLAACAAPRGAEPLRSASVQETGQSRARSFLEVLGRVEPAAERECARRNVGANCDFLVLVDDRPRVPPNAYQMLDKSGRPVLVITASLIGAVRNPDELALVMAHEAGHHIAGHLARMDQNALMGAAVFEQIASQRAGATSASIRQARQLGAEVGARSYSKEFELEADRIGAQVAFAAGYNPLLGAEFFLRLPDPGNRFLGTHPSNGERIATIRAAAAQLGPS
jgi:Zn-dependent protease with chaperone function